MPILRIESWSSERAWVEERHWTLDSFVYRLGLCTTLKGTELKRLARSLRKKEISEIEIIDIELASPLMNTLESIGAKVEVLQ